MTRHNKSITILVLFGTSFFAFSLTMLSFETGQLLERFKKPVPVKTAGGFLIVNSVVIALIWLAVFVNRKDR